MRARLTGECSANFDVDPQQKIGSLSRGERAGFNLAMALAQTPELLILDEPTLGLDVVARQEFLDAVLLCTQTNTTVIYCSISHVKDYSLELVNLGKDISLLIDEDEGHGFQSGRAMQAYYYLTELMLGEYLQGRVQPIEARDLANYIERKLMLRAGPLQQAASGSAAL